jgi:hypothetical protein
MSAVLHLVSTTTTTRPRPSKSDRIATSTDTMADQEYNAEEAAGTAIRFDVEAGILG